jgi:hypothetical protein
MGNGRQARQGAFLGRFAPLKGRNPVLAILAFFAPATTPAAFLTIDEDDLISR